MKLLLGKAITGARVAKAKNSPSVTVATKAAALRQPSLKLVKPKRFTSAVVSSQRMAFCVTEAITLFEAVAPSFLLRLGTDWDRLHYDRDRNQRAHVVFTIAATPYRRVSLVARLSLGRFCFRIFSVGAN